MTHKLIRFKGAVYRLADGEIPVLILVHVDSVDTMNDMLGWHRTNPVVDELAQFASSYPGHCVVVTQGWESARAAKIIAAAKQNNHGSTIMQFDEDTHPWGPFLKKLDTVLRKLQAGPIEVGGFWWDVDSGCAKNVYNFLKSKGYQVSQSDYSYSLDEIEDDQYGAS